MLAAWRQVIFFTLRHLSLGTEEHRMSDELDTFDLSLLDETLEQYAGQKGAVIPILQRAQDIYGYLPKPVLATIATRTGIPLSRLMGVATFYAQFRLQRRGKHLIRVCDGTACHVRGAPKNIEATERALDVPAGGTSSDYRYTMEIVYCLGSCGLAPVAVVDDKVLGRLTPNSLVQQLELLS
jgi:NADH-quinone oxidoreductase subunit E